MIHVRRLITALVASMIVAAAITVATAAMDHRAYLPFVRGATIRTTGPVYPPSGTFCMLQTSAAYVIDPRTDTAVYGCESKSGHGYVVFGDGRVLLLDHVATGSGSLTIVDEAVYVVAAREDGGLEVQMVPTP